MRTVRLISSFIALIFLCGTGGCIIDLTGEGRTGFGHSTTSETYAFHTTDGDKQESASKSELTINTSIIEWLFGDTNEDTDPEPTPAD